MAIFNWMSVCLLTGFDAKLLYGFTIPIKGEGGGEKDVPSELLQPSLAFWPPPRVSC